MKGDKAVEIAKIGADNLLFFDNWKNEWYFF